MREFREIEREKVLIRVKELLETPNMVSCDIFVHCDCESLMTIEYKIKENVYEGLIRENP